MRLANALFMLLLSLAFSVSVMAKTINEGVTEDRLNEIFADKQFFIMEPPLLCMLKIDDMTRNPHYVQIFLALRSNGKSGELDYYEPKLRNSVVNLFAKKTFSYLSTLRGRRLISFELLKAVQRVMWLETGDPTVTEVEIIELIVE